MNLEFLEALNDLSKEKGIDSEVIIEAIEAGLVSAYKKNFGSLQNVKVQIDRATGEFNVYARKEVVEEVFNKYTEITLDEARKIFPAANYGDIVDVEMTPRDFGRIAAQTAKQVVVQRIREAERGLIYNEFSNKEGDIVTGTIQRIENKNYYIDLGKIEAVLTPAEQIAGEEYKVFDRIRTYIVEVKKSSKGPQIMVSRTHPGLLKRLFELEVPEIQDGTVEIKSVAREAGARSKIAVYSANSDVDCVGACVGPKGTRVQAIVNELRGEKIDIVEWSKNPEDYIASALSPSKVVDVAVFENEKKARVIVPDYQLSLAIGKEGQNARLAAKLTGWKIDIKSESQAQTAGIEYGHTDEYDDEYDNYTYGENYDSGYDYDDEYGYDEEYDDYDEEYSGSYAEDYGEYNDDYDDEYDEAEPDEEYGEEEDR